VLAIAGEPALDFQPKPRAPRAAEKPALDDEWVDEPVIFGPGCTDVKPKAQVVRFMDKRA
jgi:hypothetical protein